jgi:hypothetical protein
MARSLEMQPRVHGFLTSSWFHSPATHAITPHLAWLNEVPLRNGAIVATMGPADPECGVLNRSPERRQAYEQGRFKPTLGLVVWPRDAMIDWANRHPEFDESGQTAGSAPR